MTKRKNTPTSNVPERDEYLGQKSAPCRRFGGCPECGCDDGFLNLGREHWFVCHRHQVTWCVGSNLFGCWRQETEQDWKANLDRIGHYKVVDGYESDLNND